MQMDWYSIVMFCHLDQFYSAVMFLYWQYTSRYCFKQKQLVSVTFAACCFQMCYGQQ